MQVPAQFGDKKSLGAGNTHSCKLHGRLHQMRENQQLPTVNDFPFQLFCCLVMHEETHNFIPCPLCKIWFLINAF